MPQFMFSVAVLGGQVAPAERLRDALARIPHVSIDYFCGNANESNLASRLRTAAEVTFVDSREVARAGREVLQSFRAAGNRTGIAILGEENDARWAAEWIRAGADDYLIATELSPDLLTRSLKHVRERYLRRESEHRQRELLNKTLCGSVQMLVDLLNTTKPSAFGRSVRVHRIVQQVSRVPKWENAWETEVAAMLSQVGCAFIPDETLQKVALGRPLSASETGLYYHHPAVTSEMLRRIPRLGGVAAAVAYQEKHFDGGGYPEDSVRRENIPLGARMLKVALDFDALRQRGSPAVETLELMRERRGRYDLNVLDTFQSALHLLSQVQVAGDICRLPLADIEPHMVLEEDLETVAGAVIVPRGELISAARRSRLLALARIEPIKEPLVVRVLPRSAPTLSRPARHTNTSPERERGTRCV